LWCFAGASIYLVMRALRFDGSKFRTVNTRDRNFTQAKMQRRLEQIDESINRYLSQGLCRIAPRGLRFVSTCPRVNKMSTFNPDQRGSAVIVELARRRGEGNLRARSRVDQY
jgi:hypothetical protein